MYWSLWAEEYGDTIEIIHSPPGKAMRTGGRRNACVLVKRDGFLTITSPQPRAKKETSRFTDRCDVYVLVHVFMNVWEYICGVERGNERGGYFSLHEIRSEDEIHGSFEMLILSTLSCLTFRFRPAYSSARYVPLVCCCHRSSCCWSLPPR